MGQYQIGTVTLYPGSEKVSGESCAWLTNGVQAGHTFKLRGEDAIYRIANVDTEVTLSLTSNYSGVVGVSGEQYQICRNFTSNFNIPEIWAGDKDWAFHLTEALRIIDENLAGSGTGNETVQEHGDISVWDMDVTDLRKMHLLLNSGEMAINLPSVDGDNIGTWVGFMKRGLGEVTINPADSDLIHGQEWAKNETTQTYAKLILMLEQETEWGVDRMIGDWEIST